MHSSACFACTLRVLIQQGFCYIDPGLLDFWYYYVHRCHLMLCQYTIRLLILLIGSSLLRSVLMECSLSESTTPQAMMLVVSWSVCGRVGERLFVLHERTKGSCQKAQEKENLEGSNSPAKQPDAALANQQETSHCSDADDSRNRRQLVNENSSSSLPDTLATHVHSTPRPDLKPEKRKRAAFIAVGNPKVTVRSSENKIINSKQEAKARCDSTHHYNLKIYLATFLRTQTSPYFSSF